jgi:hypothetical protein
MAFVRTHDDNGITPPMALFCSSFRVPSKNNARGLEFMPLSGHATVRARRSFLPPSAEVMNLHLTDHK